MDRGSHFIGVGDAASGGGNDSSGLKEGDDLRSTGGVMEKDKGESGVAADHRGLILEHFTESFVEGGDRCVLAHHPGVGVADFFDRMRSQANHFRIPVHRGGIVVVHALTELDEGMLDMTRVLFILEVFGDLSVGKPAAEPGVPPEEERHQDDQPGGYEKEGAIARGHFVMRGGGGLLGGGIEENFGVSGSFW